MKKKSMKDKIKQKGQNFKFGYQKKLFEKKVVRIAYSHEGLWFFKEVDAICRGDWGYHFLFDKQPIPQARNITLFHIPTGMKLTTVEDEKVAKRIIKYMHLKVDKKGKEWHPTEKELIAFLNWHHFAQEVYLEVEAQIKGEEKREVQIIPKYEDRPVDDWDDDMPF